MEEPNIDKYTLFTKLGYTPHSYKQKAFHDETARFRIPCCGRRWGKSISAGMEMTAAMFNEDAYYWIVGPTYTLGEKEFRVVYNNLVNKLKLGKEIRKSYNAKQGDMRIEMPWNTVLEVKTAEKKDGLLGEGLNGVIMSEAARHSRETWEQYIEPALSDKLGWAIFPSTPRGYNYYHALFEMGQHINFPDYKSWRYPSWENPIVFPGGLDNQEIVRIRSTVSDSYWKQEYAADFTTFEGQIYDEFNLQHHVKNIDYNPAWKNYWALDFGFTDPFVCLDIMVDPSGNVYVWREYQVKGRSTWDHGHYLVNRENPDGFHVDAIFADPRGADEIATLAPIVGYIGANAAKIGWSQGIEAVKRHLKLQDNGDAKLIIDASCTHLIRQMSQLRAKTGKEGLNVKEGQHDYDDHGPDALRYFFTEYFVLGANSSLSDVYDAAYRGSESETFFKLHSGLTIDEVENVGY